MKFNGCKIAWTSAMKDYTEETLTKKLDRVVEDFTNSEIKASKGPNGNIKVDASINSFRAQAINEDFYQAVIDVANKLKNIITRDKKELTNKIRGKQVVESVEDLPDYNLLAKEKEFVLDPISFEEAVEQFEMTDYPFFVYKDIDLDNMISIIYRRYDAKYGVIRCK